MERAGAAPALFIMGGAPLLHPESQVFEGMLSGWRDQQLARNLSKGTIEDRLSAVQRFQRFTNERPWTWRPADVEEYTSHLRCDGRERSHSTIRGYHGHVRLFLEYVSDPRYEWTAVSERLFGTHPSQVFFEWNTAVHVSEYEGRPGRRALTQGGAPAVLRLRRRPGRRCSHVGPQGLVASDAGRDRDEGHLRVGTASP
ncbi:phage integrase N-terminal SAM-like domain-containing protein [Streptomyces sp. NPDC093089]|uniref:phage integrase N-terminal SAM-like domain-containing protein n=1 Tax=Streptomyces sp. NPDC093089 TaxID=3366024 RepID=UPI00381BC0FF